MANGIAAGGQLTTTTDVENFPGFPDGIMGGELTEAFRAQSMRFDTQIFTETVTDIDLSKRPFVVRTNSREVEAQTVIIATGAVAKRMTFPGSGEDGGCGPCTRSVSSLCLILDDRHLHWVSGVSVLHMVIHKIGYSVFRRRQTLRFKTGTP